MVTVNVPSALVTALNVVFTGVVLSAGMSCRKPVLICELRIGSVKTIFTCESGETLLVPSAG